MTFSGLNAVEILKWKNTRDFKIDKVSRDCVTLRLFSRSERQQKLPNQSRDVAIWWFIRQKRQKRFMWSNLPSPYFLFYFVMVLLLGEVIAILIAKYFIKY